MDCEPLVSTSKFEEKDDINGMILNMGSKIDIRAIFIIWVMFIFVHTEMFFDYFLCKFNNAVEDGGPTMLGTIYSSFIMLLVVCLVLILF